MFAGYFGDEERTREAFTEDGYFRTGDIVEVKKTEGGEDEIVVIARRKETYKLANGEFVQPSRLEGEYVSGSAGAIEQMYVHVDPLRYFLIAVVVLNEKIFGSKEKDTEEKEKEKQTEREVLERLEQIAIEKGLTPYERVRGVIISRERFSVENGLLNVSFKVDRRKIQERFKEEIRQLFTRIEGEEVNTAKEEGETVDVLEAWKHLHRGDAGSSEDVKQASFKALGGDSLRGVQFRQVNTILLPLIYSFLLFPLFVVIFTLFLLIYIYTTKLIRRKWQVDVPHGLLQDENVTLGDVEKFINAARAEKGSQKDGRENEKENEKEIETGDEGLEDLKQLIEGNKDASFFLFLFFLLRFFLPFRFLSLSTSLPIISCC